MRRTVIEGVARLAVTVGAEEFRSFAAEQDSREKQGLPRFHSVPVDLGSRVAAAAADEGEGRGAAESAASPREGHAIRLWFMRGRGADVVGRIALHPAGTAKALVEEERARREGEHAPPSAQPMLPTEQYRASLRTRTASLQAREAARVASARKALQRALAPGTERACEGALALLRAGGCPEPADACLSAPLPPSGRGARA